SGELSGALAEDEQVRKGVTAQTIRPVQPAGALAGGKESLDRGHLRVAVHADAAHHVVCRGPDFHGLTRDVDVAQLLELVIHAGEFALNVLRSVGDLLLDPRDVKEDAAVRAAAAFLDFANNAAGHVIAG